MTPKEQRIYDELALFVSRSTARELAKALAAMTPAEITQLIDTVELARATNA